MRDRQKGFEQAEKDGTMTEEKMNFSQITKRNNIIANTTQTY